MRIALMSLCITVVVSVSALAANEKKAGPELVKHGITSFTLDSVDGSIVKLTLREKDSPVAAVTVETLTESDHVVTFEPVAGETFVVESRMSRPEVIFRSGSESVSSKLDREEKKWKRTGSEALFFRLEKKAKIVAALLAELLERDLLKAGATARSSARSSSVDSDGTPATAIAPCAGGSTTLERSRIGRPAQIGTNEVQYPDTTVNEGTGLKTCTGPRQVCNGSDVTRSRACNKAKKMCAAACWNQYCIGCCKYDDCNGVCYMDDVWCAANMDGYACAYADVNPPKP